MLYRNWRDRLTDVATVCAVRLPGRESRLNEPAFESMDALVDALAAAIEPYLERSLAFFGHSMGAAIAFELARRLRTAKKPMPRALHVSAARAPRFRLNYKPPGEPDENTFVEELRRLGGMPPEIFGSEDLMRIAMPALQADARLYRNYVYLPGEPLSIPMFAYHGADDPNVSREHMEAWRAETTGDFRRREFPGGHFFIQTAPEWLDTLAADLRSGR
jgi:medium-chain acyl-[acyl-carrier-protein] hydrolase